MNERFDELTRALARGASRREAVKALAAGAGAVLVTWLGAGRAAAGDEDDELFGGDCRLNGTPCRFDRQCCTRNCVDAQCKCRNEGIRCRSSAQCCSDLCEKGICNCRGFKEACTSDEQCCEDNAGTGRRGRPGVNGHIPRRISCRNGICTCSDFKEPCSTSEDCCFSDLVCFKGLCLPI